jgi:DNA-binding response OmpR family regulator
VEDNQADVFLIREAIDTARLAAEIHVVYDGEQATRYCVDVNSDDGLPAPAMVILDINLPKKQGGKVLEEMRKTPRCKNALVLVVTSSDSDADRAEMARLGANGYFRKPSDFEGYMKLGGIVKELLQASKGVSGGPGE